MSNYDRRTHLEKVHIERKTRTQKKVDDALKRLMKAQKSINFNSVAAEASVSKATLYNTPEIRTRIDQLRQQEAHVYSPKQVKREMDDSNKDVLIASLKRKIKKLTEENKLLRNQLEVSYADVYRKI